MAGYASEMPGVPCRLREVLRGMSIAPAAVIELRSPNAPIDIGSLVSVLNDAGYDGTVRSDTSHTFEEDREPFRTGEVRDIDFPEMYFEFGRSCVSVHVHCYDWKYLPDSPADCTRLIALLEAVRRAVGSARPFILFPESNMGYDDALLLSPVAPFDEVNRFFSAHGEAAPSFEHVLKLEGNLILGSRYLVLGR